MSANATIATSGDAATRPARPAVRLWLAALAVLIAAMVLVGGATRLTDSGLSITEWQLVIGTIPPLSEADWQAAFDLYRQTPEFSIVNPDMTLDSFKTIYWWEWAHRFLGRFVGLATIVPFAWFWMRGALARPLAWRLGLVVVLVVAQGVLGWYMVMSGLVERVDVSQYRLAAHLGLAFALFGYVVWLMLRFAPPRPDGATGARNAVAWAAVLVVLVFAQILMGAFVAGIKAGYGYNTWPLMDGALVPSGLGAIEPLWRNLFENALTVQFIHRMLAYLIALYVAVLAWRLGRQGTSSHLRRASAHVAAAVWVQVGLGIATLLTGVQIGLALLHQGTALAVLALALVLLHETLGPRAG